MKKFLAITLALLMVLSSVVIVSAAEPEYVVLKTILVDNCDTDTVWKDSHPAGSISVDTEDKQEGTGSVAYTRSGAGGAGHFQLRMNLTAREDETAQFINLETIENTRLAFDFYVSDPAPVKDVNFYAELCSDGKSDGEESAKMAKFFANCVAGWNTIYIDLATLGNGCNWAHFNYIRIFNQDTADFGDGWTCKIDNVRFEVVGEKPTSGVVDSILVEGCEADVFGGQVSTEQKTEGNSSVKMVFGADQAIAPGAIMWRKVLDTAIDASNMTRFAFDIYVSDPAAFSAFDFCLELTSAGKEDAEEHQVIKSLAKLTETKTLVEGWNTCYINIVDATGCDFSRFNFLRFFSNGSGTLGAEVTVYLDNFRFEQYVEPPVDDEGLEIQSFTVFQPDEQNFLVRTNAGDNGNQRFSDGNFETVYKFSVVNRFSVEKVTFTATTNAQLLLQVSQNDKDWTDVYRFEYDPTGEPNQGLPEDEREYDLTPFVDLKNNGDIYIRFADAEPSNGWGGSIFKTTPAKLTVKYTPISDDDLNAIEMAPGEGSVAIYGFNKPSGGMDIDKTDKKAGAASNTFETQKGQVFSISLPEAIDATGMDTLTFDLYVSDLAYFDYYANKDIGGNSGLEITSSGTYDKEEISWTLADIKAKNIGGDLVVGWNHIVLPLDTAGRTTGDLGETNMAALNFIRFFMVGGEDEACGITVKIDNMRMDNSGIARAAEQEAKDKEAAAKVDELIDKIGEVTLDSENKINKAEEAYKKLTAAAKKFVTKKDVLDAAKDKYKELVEAASGESADKEAAAKVDELIDKIGEVTVDSESKIKEAEEAYEKLSDAAKKLVTKKDVLDAAKAKYQELTKEPTEAPKEGCASALTVGAGAMMLLAAAWVTMAARKKED